MRRAKNMITYTIYVERHDSHIYGTVEYTHSLARGIYGNKNTGFDYVLDQYTEEFSKYIENNLGRFLDTRPPVSVSCKSDAIVIRQEGDSGISFEIRPYEKDQILISSDAFGSLRMLKSYIAAIKQQYNSCYIWHDNNEDVACQFHIGDIEYHDGNLSITCKGKRNDTPVVLMYIIENILPAGSTNFSAASISVHLPAGVRKSKANEKIYIEAFLEHLLIMP